MTEDRKLTEQEKERVLKGFKEFADRGYLDPKPIFSPEGFDLSLRYVRDERELDPIPEFRVYAQHSLTLLAIVLFACRDLLPSSVIPLECTLDASLGSLNLVLLAKIRIPTGASSDGVSALHKIGSLFATALKTIFPRIEAIFWDCELPTGFAKLWTIYPGQMTPDGFLANSREPMFSWTARTELRYPKEDQQKRASAILQFLDDESPARDI